ncbi:hypothetical protein Q5W88_21480 [Shouchella clausii]|uniref:hypothetical protein n=1 Tax=Shouchella clausii TaxID=79880 RepID=UPI0026F4752E|nr:hypothetical protein [Shouchella clausii]MDO7285878.1 hypothetical protein [Shouchella clausii]MDO7305781.1 hypothetical protein [Shouchella clausii]
MDEPVKCAQCSKEITIDMEAEYSRETGDLFCKWGCALEFYFDYMGGVPAQLDDEETLAEQGYLIKNGKVYYK